MEKQIKNYINEDELIKDFLESSKTIAMIGVSSENGRAHLNY